MRASTVRTTASQQLVSTLSLSVQFNQQQLLSAVSDNQRHLSSCCLSVALSSCTRHSATIGDSSPLLYFLLTNLLPRLRLTLKPGVSTLGMLDPLSSPV